MYLPEFVTSTPLAMYQHAPSPTGYVTCTQPAANRLACGTNALPAFVPSAPYPAYSEPAFQTAFPTNSQLSPSGYYWAGSGAHHYQALAEHYPYHENYRQIQNQTNNVYDALRSANYETNLYGQDIEDTEDVDVCKL